MGCRHATTYLEPEVESLVQSGSEDCIKETHSHEKPKSNNAKVTINEVSPLALDLSPARQNSPTYSNSSFSNSTFRPRADIDDRDVHRTTLASSEDFKSNDIMPMVNTGRQITPAFGNGSDFSRQVSPNFGYADSDAKQKAVEVPSATKIMPRFVSLGDDQYFPTLGDRAMQMMIDQQSSWNHRNIEDVAVVGLNEIEETSSVQVKLGSDKPGGLFVICIGCGSK